MSGVTWGLLDLISRRSIGNGDAREDTYCWDINNVTVLATSHTFKLVRLKVN